MSDFQKLGTFIFICFLALWYGIFILYNKLKEIENKQREK